jgi:hypothetical protein
VSEPDKTDLSAASAGAAAADDDRRTLRRLGALFAAFAVVCLAAGASRMAPGSWELRPFGDVLRVREALSMFVYAPAVCALFWLFSRTLGGGRTHAAIDVLMVLTVYLIACGMGVHDPTNRMQGVYRPVGALSPEVRRSLAFLDDQLGHWIFWAGFVLGTWVLGVQQALRPLRARMPARWSLFFGGVAAALLWVMLTNLWDEYPKTREDLCVILAAALVPLAAHAALCRRAGLLRLPVLLVIYPAYFGSVAGTLLCWLIRYGRI